MKRRVLYVLFLLIFVPLGTELAYRGFLRSQGEPYESARARARVIEIASSVGPEAPQPGDTTKPLPEARTVLAPYTGFDYDGTSRLVAQDLAQQAASPDTFDVLVVGGSVAVQVTQVATRRIIEVMRADPRFANRRVRVLPYARSSFKQPQQVSLISWLLALGLEPDAVVNLDGFNEAAIPQTNVRSGYHPSFPFASRWRTLTKADAIDPEAIGRLAELYRRRDDLARAATQASKRSGIFASAVLGRAKLTQLSRLRQLASAATEDYEAYMSQSDEPDWRTGPEHAREPEDVAATAVRIWLEGSLSIAGLCTTRGIPYVHMLQPTMRAPGTKKLSPEEQSSDMMGPIWGRGVKLAYPVMRESGPKLAEAGAHFFDGSMLFSEIEEQIYFDGCHLLERGNLIVGEAIARELLRAID